MVTVSSSGGAVAVAPVCATPRFGGGAPSQANAVMITLVAKLVIGRVSAKVWLKSVSVPPAVMESFWVWVTPFATHVAVHPTTVIPLRSVARTVIESATSARLATVNVTTGGVVSATVDD